MEDLWKQNNMTIMAWYKPWSGKWNFPWVIYIRPSASPKEIYEEIMHAIRYNKWRNVKYENSVSYNDTPFEISAKKWAEYFWK